MICAGKTSSGRCRAHAQSGSHFCFFHDPKTRKARRKAQRLGGRRRSHVHGLPLAYEFNFSDPRKISDGLTVVANQVYSGDLDPHVALALCRLSDSGLRAFSAGVLADRVRDLEKLQEAESVSGDGDRYAAAESEGDRSFRELVDSALREQVGTERHAQDAKDDEKGNA